MISPVLNPMLLLLTAVGTTAVAGVVWWSVRRRHQRTMLALAREWGMHYSPHDRFDLASRVAAHLPIAGAADVRCRDLVYGNEPAGHRCIFCAEFTVGIVRAKTRRHCVVSILEPPSRGEAAGWLSLQLAPPELPLMEQYRAMKT